MPLTTGFFDSDGIWRNTVISQRPIVLVNPVLAAGTALAAFANGVSTTPGLAVDNSEITGIRWNNDAAPVAFFIGTLLPHDRQPNTDVAIKILAAKSGATSGDATTFTIGAFMVALAALQDADADAGGATGAMTGAAVAKTLQLVSRTLAAADVSNATLTAPAHLTLSVKPTAGTLGTDDVTITSMWLEYTRIVAPS